jgi:hypothetical protein
VKKKMPPRLILNRETIRQLDPSTLQGVAGGVPVPPITNSHGDDTLCETMGCRP